MSCRSPPAASRPRPCATTGRASGSRSTSSSRSSPEARIAASASSWRAVGCPPTEMMRSPARSADRLAAPETAAMAGLPCSSLCSSSPKPSVGSRVRLSASCCGPASKRAPPSSWATAATISETEVAPTELTTPERHAAACAAALFAASASARAAAPSPASVLLPSPPPLPSGGGAATSAARLSGSEASSKLEARGTSSSATSSAAIAASLSECMASIWAAASPPRACERFRYAAASATSAADGAPARTVRAVAVGLLPRTRKPAMPRRFPRTRPPRCIMVGSTRCCHRRRPATVCLIA
mmetsp:Transcript_5226/g.17046  ORF Transcript_5226/g.17046 Transcript_5226/m.17046 type:complete len:299 (+) Transcript_5226:78-974(+)